jgi:hypothetical protein
MSSSALLQAHLISCYKLKCFTTYPVHQCRSFHLCCNAPQTLPSWFEAGGAGNDAVDDAAAVSSGTTEDVDAWRLRLQHITRW